ncbi:hypothetical protein GCM10018980_48660 [Streptomyces capoamus]|uniref:Uncharacterized protein n=1 Tax=Streptomyces capoamus TaxID=68183 RepID=A0A919EYX3_9ACTN|nr:hypothetical protein GCM10010501_07960 [Streptomyces libani subsp. rufus]GHG60299.1 hypothetical protein GCM10018980_48660 [Streptomyces capoamus]
MSLREGAVATGVDMDAARIVTPGSAGNSTGAVQQKGGRGANGLTCDGVPVAGAGRRADDA